MRLQPQPTSSGLAMQSPGPTLGATPAKGEEAVVDTRSQARAGSARERLGLLTSPELKAQPSPDPSPPVARPNPDSTAVRPRHRGKICVRAAPPIPEPPIDRAVPILCSSGLCSTRPAQGPYRGPPRGGTWSSFLPTPISLVNPQVEETLTGRFQTRAIQAPPAATTGRISLAAPALNTAAGRPLQRETAVP